MFFDDLHILRTIDRCERDATGTLASGANLLDAVVDGQQVVEEQDFEKFIRELELAQREGYLEFRIYGWGGQPPDMQAMGARNYLANMTDFRLTPSGHDRAQARVFEGPWPDPGEDDGRPISTFSLEQIARPIGDSFAGWQLPAFLTEAGIPDQYVPEFVDQTKWRYVHEILEGLQREGAGARRVLRTFVGAYLTDELHIGPGDQSQAILDGLARQGWHVAEGNRLVVGERVPTRRRIPDEHPLFGRPDRHEQAFDCFVVLPFAEPYLTIYSDVIRPVAEALAITCGHVGEIFGPGRIMADVYSLIVGARVVIAELTGRNANVFYELGIAHAHMKPVVQLTQDINDVPFDVRDLRTIVYRWADPAIDGSALSEKLRRHLEEALR